MPELTAPFVYKNDEKRIVYGPVLVPDEKDSDDDVVTAEHIETVAHKFVEEYGNVDLMHSLNNVGRLVESYILPTDLEVDENLTVPKGSWMMGVRVTDDDTWQAVKDKKLGGFSIMALQKTAMKSAEKEKESKRVTLADLGEDWIVNAVSLVDEPAVPKAKFIAIKSKHNSNIDIDNNIVSKAIAGSLEHRRRLVDRKLETTFGSYERTPFIHSTLTDSVIFRIRNHKDELNYYQVGYSIQENGNVEFTEEPQQVRIEENVVPMQAENMLGASKSNSTESTQSQSEGFMSKFMERIGLGGNSSEKAGKAISNSNLKKLRQAREVIDELLQIGEQEREKKGKKSKEGAEDMNEQDIKKMIDENLEPINSKLDDVIEVMKGKVKEDLEDERQEGKTTEDKEGDKDEQQQQAEKGKDTDESSDTEGDYKEKYQEVLKQLEEAKNKPFSQRLAGQDDDMAQKSKDESKPDRNAFGYKSK